MLSSSASAATTNNPHSHLPPPPTSAAFDGGNNHHILLPPQLHHHHLFPHTLIFPNNNTKPQNSNTNVISSKSRPKSSVKKERHTKILTAQGPRDRRVRLSICIARKFFDLQDTLGFDKPSKTLNWLFSKSKPAIEDLIRASSKEDNKGFVDLKDNNNNNIVGDDDDVVVVKDDNSSRAKARARARARTIKKMCIKELSEAKMLLPETLLMTETAHRSVFKSPLHKEEFDKKMRACSSVWDIPQHLMMPKYFGSGDNINNGYSSSHNSGDNWNNGTSTIVSTSVSSSQVLQICRKSWGCSDHNYQS